jgi:hypothetical protein
MYRAFPSFYYVCWTNIIASGSCWFLFLGFKCSPKQPVLDNVYSVWDCNVTKGMNSRFHNKQGGLLLSEILLASERINILLGVKLN